MNGERSGAPFLAGVYRGSHLESFHTGSIAVADSDGRVLAFYGDPTLVTCLRSAAKPFQAIPLLEYGGMDEYSLSPEEIALTCGSHGGESLHVSTAAALLRKGEFDESDLLCGAHTPYDEKAAADLRTSGENPSPLHNNCSGKHAGMLLLSQLIDAQSGSYLEAGHPVQSLMKETLAEFAGVPPGDIPIAIDGCGVPAFFLPLHRTAAAYARLMAGAIEQYAESSAHIVDAMTSRPQYVAGGWSITTPLMKAFAGELLAKEGAEGLYAMAVSPDLAASLVDRLGVRPGTSVGIAIKIHDGSMTRGRNPVILRTLALLGLDTRHMPELAGLATWPVTNVVGKVVGEARADFELQFL